MPISIRQFAQEAMTTRIDTVLASQQEAPLPQVVIHVAAAIDTLRQKLEGGLNQLQGAARNNFLDAFQAAASIVSDRDALMAEYEQQFAGREGFERCGKKLAEMLTSHRRRFEKVIAAFDMMQSGNNESVLTEQPKEGSTIAGAELSEAAAAALLTENTASNDSDEFDLNVGGEVEFDPLGDDSVFGGNEDDSGDNEPKDPESVL